MLDCVSCYCHFLIASSLDLSLSLCTQQSTHEHIFHPFKVENTWKCIVSSSIISIFMYLSLNLVVNNHPVALTRGMAWTLTLHCKHGKLTLKCNFFMLLCISQILTSVASAKAIYNCHFMFKLWLDTSVHMLGG